MKFQNLLKNLFQETGNDNKNEVFDNKIATSVLFLELAYADFDVTEEEQQHINDSLKRFFDLSDDDVLELLDTAKEFRDARNDIWFFTNQIKENFDRERKIKILELLWQLVFADGYMDKYEEALMRKISTLLGLTHGEMIAAKLKAKK